jgi:hypothetical protein
VSKYRRNLGLNQGHVVTRLANAISMVTTNRTSSTHLFARFVFFHFACLLESVCLCVCFENKFKNKYYDHRSKLVVVRFGHGRWPAAGILFTCEMSNKKDWGGVYIDKHREYNYKLVLNSQNILYIRPVKRWKKFRP